MSKRPLYAIYDGFEDEILLVTEYKSTVDEFISLRIHDVYGNEIKSEKNRYQVATVTDKDHIKKLKNLYLDGERYAGYILTKSEFEWFSEYMCHINSVLLYDLEAKIIENLKYLKICDEDKLSIIKAIKIVTSKLELIDNGPPDDCEDSEIYNEENIYHMDKLVKMFMMDNVIVEPYTR